MACSTCSGLGIDAETALELYGLTAEQFNHVSGVAQEFMEDWLKVPELDSPWPQVACDRELLRAALIETLAVCAYDVYRESSEGPRCD